MKHHQMKLVNAVVDRVCDVCGSSLMIETNGHIFEEVGQLKASWGYGSKEDGIAYHLDLCENCFKVALAALKEHRRNTVMFDEDQELPGEDFGIDKFRTPN
ncbi:hypothetical protein [uncultured Tolumonas sp.]|uniref:hypothetical protein n=1 Tax=uncultured Tolumonas sp. TaxID=263765 RepID=UPI00292D64AE|nr:hypothetical protein [uncultured Tolumonas sp.]